MSVFECLLTCVIYTHELLPEVVRRLHPPQSFPPGVDMAAAAAVEPAEESGRSSDGEEEALTGDLEEQEEEEEEEAEEFTCSAYCSELSRRQNEQRKAGRFCDVTLVLTAGELDAERTQTVSAHRSVLWAASPYFALLLGGQFVESLTGRVELRGWSSAEGPDPQTVESVVQFMYTGEVRVTRANVHQVLELADRFLLEQLQSFCADFLSKRLTLSNCVAVHSLAHMYSLNPLAQSAGQMIRRNFHRVLRCDEFDSLPFHLVRDWLSDSEIAVDSEQQLFEAVVKWVNQNTEEREGHFEELFKLLRLPQMAATYLMRVVRKEPLVASSAACQELVSRALEFQAVCRENHKPAELAALYIAPTEPRLGQYMDVIMVTGGVSEGEEYLSECVGYFVDEDRWVHLPHIHNHLDGHAIASCEGHLYVSGSMEPSFAKIVERYSPSLNRWEQVSSLTTRKHSFGLSCVKDVLFSIGGHGNFSPGFKDVAFYKPEQDEWISLEPAPKILRDVKTVSVEDRFVYVMARTPVDTEQDDGLSPVITCYDTQTFKWQEVQSLPLIDSYCHFQMAVASTNFYYTASCCPKGYKTTAEAALLSIGSTIAYDILDSLPSEVLCLEGAAVCHFNEDIFIIGGWRNSHAFEKQYCKDVYRYSAEKKRWLLLPPLPQPRCRAAACHLRIPYQFLCGQQRYPVPQNLARQRVRMQQMQQLHRRTLTLRRQLQSQIEC